MTYLEKAKELPDFKNEQDTIDYWCPDETFGAEKIDCHEFTCEECWNREMPEVIKT